jgi:uncharacterized membrane protein YdbT with pleckstrin-like domain
MIAAVDLNPGERVIFSGHPSWRSILGFYIKWLFATAVVAAVVAIASDVFGDDVNAGLVTLVVLVGGGLTLLVGLIKRISTTYTITNRRLHIKRGIISREIQETRLERVQNVNHSQSVFQRLVRVGTVDFDTAAGDDYEFRFAGVANPAAVVAKVDRATAGAAAESPTENV